MASATIPIVPSSIQSRFDIISGREKCSLRLIASDGSVRFGFGALRTEPLRQSFVYRAAWELGTYYRSWRLCRQSSILCGGLDPLDSIDGCQHELDCQDFGFFHVIVHLSAFDLRVLFASVAVERPCVVGEIPSTRVLVIQSGQSSQQVIRVCRVGDNLGSRQIVVPLDASKQSSCIVSEINPFFGDADAASLAFLLHLRLTVGVVPGPCVLVIRNAGNDRCLLCATTVRVVDVGLNGSRDIRRSRIA